MKDTMLTPGEVACMRKLLMDAQYKAGRELKAFNCYRRAQVILTKAERRTKRVKKVNNLLLDAVIIRDVMTIDNCSTANA